MRESSSADTVLAAAAAASSASGAGAAAALNADRQEVLEVFKQAVAAMPYSLLVSFAYAEYLEQQRMIPEANALYRSLFKKPATSSAVPPRSAFAAAAAAAAAAGEGAAPDAAAVSSSPSDHADSAAATSSSAEGELYDVVDTPALAYIMYMRFLRRAESPQTARAFFEMAAAAGEKVSMSFLPAVYDLSVSIHRPRLYCLSLSSPLAPTRSSLSFSQKQQPLPWQVYVAAAQTEFTANHEPQKAAAIFAGGLAHYFTEPHYLFAYLEFLEATGNHSNLTVRSRYPSLALFVALVLSLHLFLFSFFHL